jgi:hypothetical protein
VNLHDWIDELCDALDVEDVDVDEGLLADLATAVTDNVQPAATGVTAYLLGYAAATHGAGPDGVERLAAAAQALAEEWDRPHDPTPDPYDDSGYDGDDEATIDHSGDVYESV